MGRSASTAWGMRALAPVLLLACSPPEATPAPPPGEGVVIYEQIALPGPSLGQAALIRAGDAAALIDLGNDAHADVLLAALAAHGLDAVDHVLLTHLHADHIGGASALLGTGAPLHGAGVVWRGPVHTEDANGRELAELIEVLDGGGTALCDASGCPGLPWSVALGPARLTVFLVDAHLATEGGVVPLDVDPDDENARSLGAVLSVGDFDLVLAGDLTGGGKGTPDVEGAVAARAAELPWVPAGRVEVVVLNHHGISSSTSAAWAEWLLDGGEEDANAIVGANGSYLDAPSEEALDAVRPWLGAGAVWATDTGLLGGADPVLVVADGPVRVTVDPGGATYAISAPGADLSAAFAASP